MDNGTIVEFLGRDGFTEISNPCLRDNKLSLGSIGVLSNMLSVAKWWKYSVSGLAALHTDGRTRVTTSLRQLEEHGYLEKNVQKNPDGTFACISYAVSDRRMDDDPLAETAYAAQQFRKSNMVRVGFEGTTKIPNAPFKDKALSFKAVGLLVLLTSLPSWWHVSISAIKKMVSDGSSSIKSTVAELEERGYLRRLRERRPDGTLANAVWIITYYPEAEGLQARSFGQERLDFDKGQHTCQPPMGEKPTAEKPAAEKPMAGFEHNKQRVNKPLFISTPIVDKPELPSFSYSGHCARSASTGDRPEAAKPVRTEREDEFARLCGIAVNRGGLSGEEGRKTRQLWNEQVRVHGAEIVVEAYKRYVADRIEKGQKRYIRRLSRWLDASKADGVFFWAGVVVSEGVKAPKKKGAKHARPKAQFRENPYEFIERVDAFRAGIKGEPPHAAAPARMVDLNDVQTSKMLVEESPLPTTGPFAEIAAGMPAREAFAAYFAEHAKSADEVRADAQREFGIEPSSETAMAPSGRSNRKAVEEAPASANDRSQRDVVRSRRDEHALEMVACELGIDRGEDPVSFYELALSMGIEEVAATKVERQEGDAV